VTRVLAIMGSGETAPTMVKVHRDLLERAGPGPAVGLDTPYGFQVNAEEITRRTRDYFAASVGRAVRMVPWRCDPGPGLERERALAAVREAVWVFAGPGSPTYALRQWRDTPLPGVLRARLDTGGVLVFASAAAVTLGALAVPVYEIYKAGEEPRWERGLDLVEPATGLPAVVIPHFDNAEGGHYDTRYCYLGEQRLRAMEDALPDGVFVLGVDEHTCCALDLDARTATVLGNGTVTVRRGGRQERFPAGSVVPFDELAAAAAGARPDGRPRLSVVDGGAPVEGPSAGAAQPSLRAAADACDHAFHTALSERDVDGCVRAVLDLEQVCEDWSADTLTSDERDHARGLLRGMVVALGDLARAGTVDPRERIAPYVQALLDVRAAARSRRDYATSDAIRDRLAGLGVEVRDTPGGAEWHASAPGGDGA
jgi:hypothetical protein